MVTDEGLGQPAAASETNTPPSLLTDCLPAAAQLLKSVFVKNVGWATQVRDFYESELSQYEFLWFL